MTYLLGIVLVQFIFSFLASAAFAIIINVPRRSLVACGLTGSVSWMLYWVIVEEIGRASCRERVSSPV